MAQSRLPPARWWYLRRAQNRKPATYRCPLCGNYLPALSEHVLMVPEGDSARRRHAHSKCVVRARARGQLPSRAEWMATQPRRPGLLRRIIERVSGSGG